MGWIPGRIGFGDGCGGTSSVVDVVSFKGVFTKMFLFFFPITNNFIDG